MFPLSSPLRESHRASPEAGRPPVNTAEAAVSNNFFDAPPTSFIRDFHDVDNRERK